MSVRTPESRMRGVAWDYDGCAIELGHEPEHYFSKISKEHLPPAHQCGMAAAAAAKKKAFALADAVARGIRPMYLNGSQS